MIHNIFVTFLELHPNGTWEPVAGVARLRGVWVTRLLPSTSRQETGWGDVSRPIQQLRTSRHERSQSSSRFGLAAGLGVAGMVGAGMASADVSTNDTTADRTGYGIANHIAIFNGDQDGIGWTRSVEKGTISDAVGFNKAPQVTISTQ